MSNKTVMVQANMADAEKQQFLDEVCARCMIICCMVQQSFTS